MLNFSNYDDERYELVYVQTKRDIYNLLDTLGQVSAAAGSKDITINVLAQSYWPLPWYLRGYKNARFWGRVIDDPASPIILVDTEGEKGLKEKLRGSYETKLFVLRPGVWIAAYIQKGLYEAVYGKKVFPKTGAKPIHKISRDELEPGLWVRYYENVECLGAPFLSRVEGGNIYFTYLDPAQKPYRSPFGVEWEGYLLVEQRGLYQFATRSDDGSEAYIDGDMVIDNRGFHAMQYVSGTVFLDEGFHHLSIKYFDGGGGASMEFLWVVPGGSESLVPPQVFYHRGGIF